eukprot:7072741-Prymnesium_polylepis.1
MTARKRLTMKKPPKSTITMKKTVHAGETASIRSYMGTVHESNVIPCSTTTATSSAESNEVRPDVGFSSKYEHVCPGGSSGWWHTTGSAGLHTMPESHRS